MTRNVPKGLYRNDLGAELHVGDAAWEQTIGIRTLSGDIAIATRHDDLFGTWTYLVTEVALAECGYKLIKEGGSDV